jgi:hypothetical protein
VAGIAAEYIRNFDPAWEKGWIAEIDGERVGSCSWCASRPPSPSCAC